MSTDKVKASPFNPVDHMETDEEIIEFLVDCTMKTLKDAYTFEPANF